MKKKIVLYATVGGDVRVILEEHLKSGMVPVSEAVEIDFPELTEQQKIYAQEAAILAETNAKIAELRANASE